jgi:hypothetical protein
MLDANRRKRHLDLELGQHLETADANPHELYNACRNNHVTPVFDFRG